MSEATESTPVPDPVMRSGATCLTIVLLLGGCGDEPSSEPTVAPVEPMQDAEPGDEAPSPEDLAHLRALGYTGVADPLDEEQTAGVQLHDRERAAQGLNLFTNAHTCSTQLMDMEGNILHEWSHTPCHRWGNAILLPNGDLIALGRTPHGKDSHEQYRDARYLMRQSWDGEILWKKRMTAHHDMDVTPDGRTIALTYRHTIYPELNPSVPLQDHILTVLDDAGTVLEEVSLYEVLTSDPAILPFENARPRNAEGRREVDAVHANVVEWVRATPRRGEHPLYDEGKVLVCMRNQDCAAIFDWESRKLVWAWGKGEMIGPHDATMLPDGNLLIFDNGLGRGWSRVLELDPRTNTILWEYRAPDPGSFYTGTRGANQRLSNGNTLIVESDDGHAFEVTPEGEVVWDFINSNLTAKKEPSVIVRMRRYEGMDYAAVEAAARAGTLRRTD